MLWPVELASAFYPPRNLRSEHYCSTTALRLSLGSMFIESNVRERRKVYAFCMLEKDRSKKMTFLNAKCAFITYYLQISSLPIVEVYSKTNKLLILFRNGNSPKRVE